MSESTNCDPGGNLNFKPQRFKKAFASVLLHGQDFSLAIHACLRWETGDQYP